ncbi:HAD-IIB family hydrolase [Actinoplanes sp. HUAS TT8]|uniref:HAD-IIB family hydrolase n=1 Tax=Actinoplanes sp. HUAS TT8 TaxID=3447453 RepID=UPI003F51EEC5
MLKPGLPKLIATDLDGTLVRSDDTVSAYTHEVLGRVRAAGIRIVAATGRGPRLASLTRDDVRVSDYLVLAQGGWVLDQAEQRYLRQARLPGAVVSDVLTRLESETGPLSVMFEALEHDDSPLWGDYDPTWRWPIDLETRTRAECLGGDVIKAYAKAVKLDIDELLAIARRVVPPDVATVTQAGLNYLEICPPHVDKGTGLAVVAEAVGVDPADVLVFGDMPNDLSMFAWAGWGRVAVANAHPELMAMADDVTLTNDQDGVAVYLERLLSR